MFRLATINCILSIIITLSGLAFLCRGACILFRLREIQSKWIKIEISIINSELATGYERIKYSDIEYFFPRVTYEYRLSEQVIRSDKVAIEYKGLWTENRVEATELLNQIHANNIAFYNPKNIFESTIIPFLSKRRTSHNWSLVVAGVILIFLGIFFCLFSTT